MRFKNVNKKIEELQSKLNQYEVCKKNNSILNDFIAFLHSKYTFNFKGSGNSEFPVSHEIDIHKLSDLFLKDLRELLYREIQRNEDLLDKIEKELDSYED